MNFTYHGKHAFLKSLVNSFTNKIRKQEQTEYLNIKGGKDINQGTGSIIVFTGTIIEDRLEVMDGWMDLQILYSSPRWIHIM